MKKYRIKNYYTSGFIVQERFMLFNWYTHTELIRTTKVFNTIEEAKDYIKELEERKLEINKAKYTEYV